ncbi:molecular chaperone DnaK [Gemmiger formicilis]|uniref:molecular chaperone DnaK n=1 Tax=Gemmiger formicilis TaxID=745368 RepID=UPI001959E454|nr:molecular chaperone DnaK [Gemmiger formicilis]MBM6716993.1 molecular chaperone DnaK [Gemmiger formicilis]
MGKIIGIDLGTTNSCVAVVEGGRPVVIPNREGQRTTPSVVAFTKTGERLVGDPAKRQAVTNAARTVCSVKRKMGSDARIPIDGKCYTPQEISALILQKLRADAEAYLGEPVTEAVITVPAYFNDAQRQATKDAGRIAGLNVRRIINEPTAAALAYGLDNGKAQTVMVYDLGGGTFDVSLIQIGDGIVQVLATCGDNHLGGDDFDERIANWLMENFRAEHGVDLHNDPVAVQRLREEAEKVKKELSSARQADINLPFLASTANGPVHLQTTLTRAKFDELTSDLVERTALPVKNALRDAGLAANDLDQVLLVGGSTRIPAVQAKVMRMIDLEPSKTLNPDECVALGAAVQGGRLGGEVLASGGESLLLMDVTPLTLSIETVGGVATHLIERNSTIPTRFSKIFTTAAPFQSTVEIKVLQGEREFARDNKLLGTFTLKGIKRAWAGVPQIEVTFDIDANGIVTVSAKDLETGKHQSITITGTSNLSEEEIQRAMRDAAMYAGQDKERKAAIEALNAAESALYRVNTALGSKAGKALDRESKNHIKEAEKALEKQTRRKKAETMTPVDTQAVVEAREQLEQAAASLLAAWESEQRTAAQ